MSKYLGSKKIYQDIKLKMVAWYLEFYGANQNK